MKKWTDRSSSMPYLEIGVFFYLLSDVLSESCTFAEKQVRHKIFSFYIISPPISRTPPSHRFSTFLLLFYSNTMLLQASSRMIAQRRKSLPLLPTYSKGCYQPRLLFSCCLTFIFGIFVEHTHDVELPIFPKLQTNSQKKAPNTSPVIRLPEKIRKSIPNTIQMLPIYILQICQPKIIQYYMRQMGIQKNRWTREHLHYLKTSCPLQHLPPLMLKTPMLSEPSSCLSLFGDSYSKIGNNLGLDPIISSEQDLPWEYSYCEWCYSCAKLSKLLEDLLVREYSSFSSYITLVYVRYFWLAREHIFFSAICRQCLRVLIAFLSSHISSSYLQTIQQSLSFHSEAICSVLRLYCDSTSKRYNSPEPCFKDSNFSPSTPWEKSTRGNPSRARSYFTLRGAQLSSVRCNCSFSFWIQASCNLSRVLSIWSAVRDCTLTAELSLLIYAPFMLMVDFFNSCCSTPVRSLGVWGVCGAYYEDFYLPLQGQPQKSTLSRQRVSYSVRCQFSYCSLEPRYFICETYYFVQDNYRASCSFYCFKVLNIPL